MEVSAERSQPHRIIRSSTSELSICFTSLLSSSSSTMKISSKSILSPGRARAAPVSLPASLSRRLRANGSLKGGQSPMFPTGAKKRGCAFENPEPSSPKVTCIGQVRVKTKKKHGKKMLTLSSKRIGPAAAAAAAGGGEGSFLRVEQSRRDGVIQSHHLKYQANANNIQQQECLPHRSQKWVHLPLTICEALKSFGAEFSCLFPCRWSSSSSCLSTSDREKDEKTTGSNERTGQRSCGAVCARWLVALQDGEGGKGREVELVVGGEEERTETTTERTFRRNAMDETGIDDEKFEVKDGGGEEENERVSICIPPKNALLLMRCRSDPMRMSALANRFWESPAPQFEEEEHDDHGEKEGEEESGGCDKDGEGEVANGGPEIMEDKDVEASEKLVSETNDEEEENPEAEALVVMEVEEAEGKENLEEEKLDTNDQLRDKEEEENEEQDVQESPQKEGAVENEFNSSSSEAIIDSLKLEIDDVLLIGEGEEEPVGEKRTSPESSSAMCANSDLVNGEAEEATLEEATEEKSTEEKETQETPLKGGGEEATVTHEGKSETEQSQMESEERKEVISHGRVERGCEMKQAERERSSALPDCLLLMGCEPKLSMEVCKETWVCSEDFIRRLPEKQPKAKDGGDEPKKRNRTDFKPTLPSHPAHRKTLHQPPRSSCSLPGAVAVPGGSMAMMTEEKLVNAVGNEPLGLTRCKSEPMRTAAAKLAPDTCFWKNRKLEPHRRATIGVGAGGVGF
ncbi:hypothetical protein U1Q18_000731 [Sarracenia purpurea var. burkii]